MQFLISDTFTDSLARLSGDEQKAVKNTDFDIQLNPVSTAMQFHNLDRAKDPNFWSVRVSNDIRMIVHRTDESTLLCFVGHHDNAYHWAERLYELQFGKPAFADNDLIQTLLKEISQTIPDQKFSQRFLLSEWEDVVDAWHLETWEAYRDVARLGRKTRLPEKH